MFKGKFVKERLTRLKTIRKLIKNYRIESQEVLLAYLEKEGYEVTQATLSRDLKPAILATFIPCPAKTSGKNQNKSMCRTFCAAT